MNLGRFLGAAVGVWIVRLALNYLFYGVYLTDYYERLAASHPGLLREVIPAYLLTDLLFAVVFALLFAKAGHALGGGVGAGIKLGILVALLSHTVASLYNYYSLTIFTAGTVLTDVVFQWVAHAIQGAAAGAVYKPASSGSAVAA